MLQKMCRKYIKRLLPAAKEVGLEEFVVTTIDKKQVGYLCSHQTAGRYACLNV